MTCPRCPLAADCPNRTPGEVRLRSVDYRRRDRALSRSLALAIASTSSSLLIRDRPRTSSRLAMSIRCALDAFASTPPAVARDRREDGAERAACGSEGPLRSFGSQWSPTFSYECLRAENAVRCARSPSPYVCTAESCVFAQVSCAFSGERRRVDGSSSLAGIRRHLRSGGIPAERPRAPVGDRCPRPCESARSALERVADLVRRVLDLLARVLDVGLG